MKRGIILESAVPMRLEPSDRAEMVNQLLFGEQYTVLLEEAKWIRVQTEHDHYQGWIDLRQHTLVDIQTGEGNYCNAPILLNHENRGNIKLNPGSFLPSPNFLTSKGFEKFSCDNKAKGLRELCQLFENAPYLWGGRTPYGIDCSGFTQIVFRLLGKLLPRDASQQVEIGEQVTFINEAKEGDLAFFDNENGKITHVGIILKEKEQHTIIHASGRVRIDKIDHNGIFNSDIQEYSHKLRTIKTIT